MHDVFVIMFMVDIRHSKVVYILVMVDIRSTFKSCVWLLLKDVGE